MDKPVNDPKDSKLCEGTITSWETERGFGFARTSEHPKVFVHFSTLCEHLNNLEARLFAAFAFDRDIKYGVPVGTVVFLIVEQGKKGLQSIATCCSKCMAKAKLESLKEFALTCLSQIFSEGHRFDVEGKPWFYKFGMPKAARNKAIEAFEIEALKKILQGAAKEEIIAAAEEAARTTWQTMSGHQPGER